MRNDRAAIPVRLETLKQSGLDASTLYTLFTTHFYFTIDDTSPDTVKTLLHFGERLLPRLEKESQINDMKVKILDCSFVAEDYDSTIRILEAGVPDHDADWHGMAICKVKAHRALQQQI